MDAVGLIEGGHPRDTFEEERDERHVIALREGRVHGPELRCIRRTEVGRRLHSCEKHGHLSRTRPLDDRGQVPLEFGGRQTAQAVVCAECED
jgi:hypothetical protein